MPGAVGLNIVLSLDYEVFFGPNTGTIERSLVEPSKALCDVAEGHGVPLVFFVDIGFLLRLREEGRKHPALLAGHDLAARQIERFVASGHEVQLHIHPHWEDSHWNGSTWTLDTRRYCLHDFDQAAITEIVRRYANALRTLTGGTGVSAFRAGGWAIQPFRQIRQSLLEAGIRLDSTVFAGGSAASATHRFDFSRAPRASHWFFDEDPLVSHDQGRFLEVPIASRELPPSFFWKLALARKFGGKLHRPYGDGKTMPLGRADLRNKLLRKTTSVVSIDGFKASFLEDACNCYSRAGMSDFVVIGHPKTLTPYALQCLDRFIKARKSDCFVGFGAYEPLLQTRPLRRASDAQTTARC
jgi:hypothetical protein